MPGAFPRDSFSDDTPTNDTPTRLAKHIADAVTGGYRTPKHAAPIRPDAEEMHPKQYQTSTAKPLDEARWLGFSSIVPQTEPPKGTAKFVPAAGTPSKTPKPEPSSGQAEYQFTFRAQSLELSNEARNMMAEKREEAARIKEQMVHEEDARRDADAALGRKLATPKGRVDRFSDVHMAHFKKMDSISKHAAASRQGQTVTATQGTVSPLKRTSSKAGLAQGGRAGPKPVEEASASREQPSQRPRSNSTKSLGRNAQTDTSSPAKRFKRIVEDDAGTARPSSSSGSEGASNTTPKSLRLHANNPHLTKASTPTQTSLVRQASVKSSKTTMIPTLSRSPSKSTLNSANEEQSKPPTPLLSRSPSKMPLPSTGKEAVQSEGPHSPLLARSPCKPVSKPEDKMDVDLSLIHI